MLRGGFQASLLMLLGITGRHTSPPHLGFITDWGAVLLVSGCSPSFSMLNAEQPCDYLVIGDVALTNMVVGNKAAPLVLPKQAVNVVPLEKKRSMVSRV